MNFHRLRPDQTVKQASRRSALTDGPITAQMTHRSEASAFSLAVTAQRISQKAVLASCCSDVICHRVMWGGAVGTNFLPIRSSAVSCDAPNLLSDFIQSRSETEQMRAVNTGQTLAL